ncbi:UDP-N-acetylglucosamine acyltransferase-like protein [Phaeobacter piscinae]|uniref:acyltransferase n=1 Tax=Phaeobacter piscinae TaxID=1580596 RepID=UPI000C9D1140|nr:acyltransferase [Phaeobacter piscinae]AUQ72970.1 UDP-N-acetylglucosamine acyltransferase-like protein [Phaeobacter piscinae]AUR37205.1 UDP-N-acetylglucosamine acyltransferase-like protein [Phaeobacter piscinae]
MRAHPTAIVSPKAKIHPSVEIGPFSIVHDNVEIGAGTNIGSNCELGVSTRLGDGSPLRIGEGSTIRSHSVFYESSSFGDGLVTGHRVTVRELTQAGRGVQIGTLSDIQGHCTVGDYVRLHSNVHIGQKSVVEDYVWIFPYVVLTNDPHPPSEVLLGARIKSFAVIATMTTVLPGVTVGEGALVGACSAVTKDVADHRIAVGNPAVDRGDANRVRLKDGTDRAAYPWKSHFHRGYPEAVVAEWMASLPKS